MNNDLSILKKGIILIAVPLAFELAFFVLVLRTQRQVADAQGWAIHTKVVLAQVESLYRRLTEGQGALARLALTGDLGRYEKAEQSLRQVKGDAAELVELVGDNKEQQARARGIVAASAGLVAWQEEVAGLVRAARRDEAAERVKAPDAPARLDAVRAAIDDFRAEEEQLDRRRMEDLGSSTRGQAAVMIAGGLGSLAGAVALLAYFGRGIARRFAVLGENARRLAEGRELSEPLTGRDEIAALDRTFHDMARSIAEKERENELFIYSVSHDLRSPLVNLQGFSQELGYSSKELRVLFEDEAVPEPVRKRGLAALDREVDDSIHFIQTAVSRLSVIIDALLRLSRAGRVEYRMQAVDVDATVRRVVDALGSTIAGRGAEVTARPMPPTWGDPTAVEQIFANLVGNAVNYLDPSRPGRIEVGALDLDGAAPSNGPGRFTYYVRDNGLGIPESGMAKLFLAFQRFHDGRARGEGIGLALVRKIVERHGGAIRAESGAGRRHDLLCRIAGPPARRPGRARPGRDHGGEEAHPMSPEPLTILLAEDDDGHANLIHRNLERAGLANGFVRVRDGQEALDLIRREGEHAGRAPLGDYLLLLDINMPRVDGVEVLRQVKADPALVTTPVIMLTTTDDPREIERCYKYGCNVYITKPVAYDKFVEAIRQLGLFLQVVKVPPNGGRGAG